ncbi:serine protease hepsin-like isoform X2 [Cimex lectularius]|nr:serine protease hepsin-like isoform X2 [Cimex lectularius]XP_024085540.1 serine protease hepsin-like isoform X2 [Cimex lectularius]
MSPTALLIIIVSAVYSSALPLVDPGLFVISGVKTCGNGEGYCLLGTDCSLDKDFMEDRTGHCGGLRGAFTPSAHFICCSDSKKGNEVEGNIIHTTNFSKYPPDIEADMTTENIETTTLSMDNIILESETTVIQEGVKCNMTNTCDSTIAFSMEGSQFCMGSYVGAGWVVTSASCAMEIFRLGMKNVGVNFMAEPNILESFVKTIIVHENYRPTAPNLLLPEINNLGLVQLKNATSRCALCLPTRGQGFTGQVCKTFPNENTSDTNCEAEVESLQGTAKEEFLTLPCNGTMQLDYQREKSEKGKPLICEGYLSGVETSAGIGMTIFTQLSLYSDWLRVNMEPKPTQHFRTS